MHQWIHGRIDLTTTTTSHTRFICCTLQLSSGKRVLLKSDNNDNRKRWRIMSLCDILLLFVNCFFSDDGGGFNKNALERLHISDGIYTSSVPKCNSFLVFFVIRSNFTVPLTKSIEKLKKCVDISNIKLISLNISSKHVSVVFSFGLVDANIVFYEFYQIRDVL